MGEFSLPHILIVLVIVLIFFGPGRLPGLGKSLGEAIRGFKQGISPDDHNNQASHHQTNLPPPAPHAHLNQVPPVAGPGVANTTPTSGSNDGKQS